MSTQQLPKSHMRVVIISIAIFELVFFGGMTAWLLTSGFGIMALPVLMFGGSMALIAPAVIIAVVKAEEKRRADLAALYQRHGFECTFDASYDQREFVLQDFKALVETLSIEPKHLRHVAKGEFERRAITSFEQQYSSRRGNSNNVIRNFVVATPCPDAWPVVTLSPEHMFTRLGALLGQRDLELDSPEFNRAWRVKTDDEDFATLLLSPELQSLLTETEGDELWVIGGGRICCVRRAFVKPEEIETIFRRVSSLAEMIAPELEAWSTSDRHAA